MVGILNTISSWANLVYEPRSPTDSSSLEVKVKAKQQFAGIHIQTGCSNHGSGPVLMQPVVLVVPGKTCPARHERVIAVADCVRSDIAQIGWSRAGVSARSGSRVERSVGLL